MLPEFDAPDLAVRIERMTDGEIDQLPFGTMRVNAQGIIEYYSQAERRLSGSGERERLGRHLFNEIAPCMDNENFRARVQRAMAQGTVNLEFTHIGDFADRNRELTVRILSASKGGVWIFMQRED